MSDAPKTISTVEASKLLATLLCNISQAHPKRKNYRNVLMTLLMLDAGLRVGEVVRLKVSDLYLLEQPIESLHVNDRIAEKSCERYVPLTERIRDSIEINAQKVWTIDPSYPWPFAFYKKFPDHALSTRQVERIIKSAAIDSIGYSIHPHVLRHTFASRLMRTTNIRIVQQLLGHKRITSTQIYTHPNHDDLSTAIKNIDTKPPVPAC